MKRRQFLTQAATAGLLAAVPTILTRPSRALELSGRPLLKFPPLIDARETGNFALEARSSETEFIAGKVSSTLGFNQSYLGPVLRLGKGATKARVTNSAEIDVTSHWHGLLLPGESDGGPHNLIKSGGVWEPELNIDQAPCTAWYHSHVHGETARSVYAGLAGGIIIADGRDDDRGLPSDYGVDDLFLVLQDKAFSADGQLAYGGGMMAQMHGFSGDTMVVNGQIDSVAAVPKGIVRLRLLNGSNARFYGLAIDDGRPMHLIATDGGYLPKPLVVPVLRIAPGERVEFLVDFSNGEPAKMVSRTDYSSPDFAPDGTLKPDPNAFEILAFVAGDNTARITKLPDSLDGAAPDFGGAEIATTRSMELTLGMMGGMGGGMMGRRGGFAGINGQPYDMGRIDFDARKGTVEKWHIRSQMMPHPFHVHGTSFQVLSENGRSPRAENRGWKDTVVVDMEMEILVRFDHQAPSHAPFMYHCHILEHEDGGMMGQFTVS